MSELMDVREVERAREVIPHISEDTILAVKKGAAWLDERYPAWESMISLTSLNLAHENYCVLGQLEGLFDDALEKHGIYGEDQLIEEMGFNLPALELSLDWVERQRRHIERSSQWDELTDAWKNLIETRRGES